MLRRDAANNNSATTNIPQRLRDNVQAGCRQQLSSKAGRRQFIRVVKAGCRQQLSSKAGSRQLVRADKAEFCQRIRAIVAILNTNMCQNAENNNEAAFAGRERAYLKNTKVLKVKNLLKF